MNHLNSIRLTAALAATVLLWPASVSANIQVNPSIVRAQVRAGGAEQFALAITNSDPARRQFEVTVTNMTAAPEGFPVSAPADDPRGCAEWLSVTPTSFSLLPSSTQMVQCQLRAPRDAMGGYYALIVVESEVPQPPPVLGQRSGLVRLSQAFGTAVLAVVPGRGLKVTLRPAGVRLSTVPTTSAGPAEWKVDAVVGNEGNVHAKVEGSVDLRDGTGRRIARAPLDGGRGTVLPSAVREYTARQPGTLPNGVYVATVQFSVPGTKIGAASTQAFSVADGVVEALSPGENLRALMESLAPAVQMLPEEIALSGAAGSRKSSVLRLSNVSRQSIDLRLLVSEWQLSESGADAFPDAAPEHGRSAAAWLTLAPDSLSLRAGGRAGVRLTVAVPPGTPDGDYFACVRARAAHAPEDIFYPSYATIKVSVGRSAEASCEINHISVSKPNTQEAGVDVSLTNSGSRATYPIVTVSIADIEGKTVLPVTRMAAGEYLVLPRQVRRFTMPLDLVLRPGRYVATVTAMPRENAAAVSDTVSFDAPPWQDVSPGGSSSPPAAAVR